MPFPSPGDLRNPGIEPRSPAVQVDSLPSERPEKPFFILYGMLLANHESNFETSEPNLHCPAYYAGKD